MKKILPILTLIIFLLTFTKVSASLATDYPNVSGKQIIIKTYITATQANNEWPKLQVYANNGAAFWDNNCSTGNNTYCGTPNKYLDKSIGTINVTGASYTDTLTTTSDKLLLKHPQQNKYSSLISFVYYNDFWQSATVDRNVYISKVEIIDAADNSVLKTYNASSFAPTSEDTVYFDMGLVNIEGDVDTVGGQDGMKKAFDSLEVWDEKKLKDGKWELNQDGSFVIQTYEIFNKLVAKYPNGASPTPTPNPTPNLEYDLNGDNKFDILDLVALIRRVFQG